MQKSLASFEKAPIKLFCCGFNLSLLYLLLCTLYSCVCYVYIIICTHTYSVRGHKMWSVQIDQCTCVHAWCMAKWCHSQVTECSSYNLQSQACYNHTDKINIKLYSDNYNTHTLAMSINYWQCQLVPACTHTVHHSTVLWGRAMKWAMSYLDKEAYEITVISYDDPQHHGD